MAKRTTLTAKTVAANNMKARELFLQTNPEAINYRLRMESIDTVQSLIKEIGHVAGMDSEALGSRISMATSRSEYGKVPGLINLLSSVCNWPLDKDASTSGMAEAKEAVAGVLPDLIDVLEDIKQAKGYHTFVSDEHELVDGIEPDFEEYTMLLNVVASNLQLPVLDVKLSEAAWERAEDKAYTKAKESIEAIKVELEEHQKLHGAA